MGGGSQNTKEARKKEEEAELGDPRASWWELTEQRSAREGVSGGVGRGERCDVEDV